MQRVVSKQTDVLFVYCPDPITIDKRADWKDWGLDNLQSAPNGAFLKIIPTPCSSSGAMVVSHLVQSNADKTAPIGWIPGSGPGLFSKAPIYIGDLVHVGTTVNIHTLDGPMSFTPTELSAVCANEKDGKPDLNDMWVNTLTNIIKHYVISWNYPAGVRE